MNRFFSHLIDRHQTQALGDQQQHTTTVQPRPKSRFERESVFAPMVDNTLNNKDKINRQGTATHLIETDAIERPQSLNEMEANSVNHANLSNLSSIPSVLAEQQNQIHTSDQPINDGSKSIEALTIKLNQQQATQEQEKGQSDTQPLTGMETIPESNSNADKPTSHTPTLDSEINHRIKDILLRLQHSTTADTENKSDASQPHHSPHTDSSSIEIPVADLSSPLLIPTEIKPPKSEHLAKTDEATDVDQANKQVAHPSALLQTPDWLAQMQADMKQRWQHNNPQVATEPMVNVTIGRIEVRASQSETKTSTTARKPSGVMSLDDYLKQRDNRGRV